MHLSTADTTVNIPGNSAELDHIVLAGGDLAELVDAFAEATGITPLSGGRHPMGTANFLVPLAAPAGSYLELIGPDPQAEGLSFDVFGLQSHSAARVAAYCIRPAHLDATSARYQALDKARWRVEPMSRRTAEGQLLSWRYIPPVPGLAIATFPFAIDWLDSAHPSTLPGAVASIREFQIGDPSSDRLAEELAQVGFEAHVVASREPLLRLVLDTPAGVVDLADVFARG